MSRLNCVDTRFDGLKIVERKKIGDERGFLSRIFCYEELAVSGWIKPVAQINHTYTSFRGTVRGMHCQCRPHTEMKLVSCIRGQVWDVAVDIRSGSPTFMKWHAEFLSADNMKALLIPEGFAHGFQTMTDNAELIYLHSSAHVPESEAGLNPLDPHIGIKWPLPVINLSPKDAGLPFVADDYGGLI